METKKFRILALAVCLFSLGVLFLLLSITGPVEAGPLLQEPPEERGEDEEVEAGEVLPATVVESAFTYQGRLTDSSGSPLSGEYDFEVELYNGPDPSDPGTTQVGATIAVTDVVSNGLFNLTLPVTHGDFSGQGLYLRMRVRPSGGTWDDWTGTQPILPVPYALSLRPNARIGGTDAGHGRIWVRDSSNRPSFELRGSDAGLYIGDTGVDGELDIDDSAGETALFIDGDTAELRLGTTAGGNPGDLIMRDNAGNNTIHLDGNNRSIRGGLHSTAGDLEIDSNDDLDITLDADSNSASSHFRIYYRSEDVFRVGFDGDVYADGGYNCGNNLNPSGFWSVTGETDLEAGPCLTDDTPADFAEMMAASGDPVPGDVLVINAEGRLIPATTPYASNVVGVYSTQPSYLGGGAKVGQEGYVPLAIMGIVPCKVSAENGPIVPGDLLTTSSTPGHAMRAGDNPAPGTILGKALGELKEGTGTIEVLVTLQ